MHLRRYAEQKRGDQRRADFRPDAREHAESAEQDQHARARDGHGRRRHVLAPRVLGHHAEIREVVDAVVEEVAADERTAEHVHGGAARRSSAREQQRVPALLGMRQLPLAPDLDCRGRHRP